ncbi:hypothetical protein ACOSQ4_023857 [Xanthoceras sorbifolium]
MNSLKKGSMGMADYILKMKGFADCLTSAGQPTSDQDVIMSVLNGLGLEYDSVVVNLTSREDHVTLSEAQYMLLSQEQRLERLHSTTSLDLSNATANYVARPTQRYGGRGGHRGGKERGSGRGKVMCQLYGKTCHIVSMCYKRFDESFYKLSINQTQSPLGSNQNSHNQQASLALNNSSQPSPKALLATHESVSDSNWYFNSGATSHVTADANTMNHRQEYRSTEKLAVGLENEENSSGRNISQWAVSNGSLRG